MLRRQVVSSRNCKNLQRLAVHRTIRVSAAAFRSYDQRSRQDKQVNGQLPISSIRICPRHDSSKLPREYPMNHQRQLSSWASIMPEFAQSFTIFGASGKLIKALHMNGTIPYWACFSVTNIIVRTSLIPLALKAAFTSARFAVVAPEVQFAITLYQKDLEKMRKEKKARAVDYYQLTRMTMGTIGSLYKYHKVNPFDIFKSPLMQIPVFWYFSVDIRKIINGADPALAQELTENGVLWVTDLTDPDPWYGLPILCGVLLYLNVEVATGRRSLSGEIAAKSNVAVFVKDTFQTLAVFMPCLTCQSPAGVQIYLATSFLFTMMQGGLLRSEPFRAFVGLPSMLEKPQSPEIVTEFMELAKLNEEAKKLRGNGPVLGTGVLAIGWEASFSGTSRPTTIAGSAFLPAVEEEMQNDVFQIPPMPVSQWLVTPASFQGPPTVEAPWWQQLDDAEQELKKNEENDLKKENQDSATIKEREYLPRYSDEVIERANRGERPVETIFVSKDEKPAKVDVAQLKKKARRKAGKKKSRKR